MIESSKVAFVKKILKDQGISDSSSTNFNDGMKLNSCEYILKIFFF